MCGGPKKLVGMQKDGRREWGGNAEMARKF